ncbi:autotransporter-associated N-terminal domain-containing protein [Fusobacterium polymorphum]|uniref:autotransporter-associated N-terminal domain-containing protein n=1 Tax=Fusobacterium nucleatum subsp. polymorphum TaxID=76857 RepID=UPI002B4BF2C5|nr:autotransporter-associated N-terminal domain-containing protein [Fusobacterium polymorphum]WRL72551.1 autotransporter-associated N-terminal domain-containing protein [Fusobacterium polymorphum]
MENNLHKVEKDLRSIAKRYKSVKYSLGLAILFLMLGVSAFSEEVNLESSQVATREELKTSVGNVQTKLNVLRDENKEKIKNLRLELIQLMEQGDQVIKSPWSSWQFGMNYFYENWGSTYKGSGDKAERYSFNGIYTRSNWKVRNAMGSAESQRVGGTPLTPGNDSQSSWISADNISSGGVKIAKDNSINSSTNGNRRWGLVKLEDLKEPTNEVEILARISPKEVNKQAVTLNIPAPVVQTLEAPTVKPEPNKPIEAPKITLPSIRKVEIEPLSITPPSAPGAINVPNIGITIAAPTAPTPPSVNVSVSEPSAPAAPKINIEITPPEIKALNIVSPAAVTVNSPTITPVKPVAFSVAPTIDPLPAYKKSNQAGIDTLSSTIDVTEKKDRNYVTINSFNSSLIMTKPSVFNVLADNNRALVIDEAKDNAKLTTKSTINLYGSQNMGIDLQGTHNVSSVVSGKTIPGMATIINDGEIIGQARNKDNTRDNKEQIAFGFSNADASSNASMTHIINQKLITLNAPSSAAMQLKPEDPTYWNPNWNSLSSPDNLMTINGISGSQNANNFGRVLMKAENTGTISLNSKGSFGMITVFNPGIIELNTISINRTTYTKDAYNLRAQRNLGAKVLPGGEIGRSALTDSKYTSGIYNSGTIDITGDESVGVGILHEIQEVKIGGTINIGLVDYTTKLDASGNIVKVHNTPSTDKYGNVTKVYNNQIAGISDAKDSARPETNHYELTKVDNAVGVFAGVPTLPVKVGERDTMGNTATTDVGTTTTEVYGAVNIGESATGSIGLLVGDSEEDLNKGDIEIDGKMQTGVARKLKRSGSITLKQGPNLIGNTLGDGEINVDGNKNYGFVVNSMSYKSTYDSTILDKLIQTSDTKNHGIGVNEGNINVTGINSIGFALLQGGNSKNTGNIIVKESAISWHPVTGIVNSQPQYDLTQNSIGYFAQKSNFTNEGTIAVNTPNRSGNKAVLLKGDSKIGTNFTNTGDISVQGSQNIGVYAEGKYTFNHEKNAAGTNKISVGSNAIGIYAKDTTGTMNIKAPIELADSNGGTTIGIYSDGNATINFEDNSKLKIGKGAIGLFSQNTTKFKDTFKFNNTSSKQLEISLDENSAFAFFNGSGNIDIATEAINKQVKFTQMKKGATFGYAKGTSVVSLGDNIDMTVTAKFATPEDGTSVLVASEGATVKLSPSKTLKATTHIGLVATNGSASTKPKAINEGTIEFERVEGVGLYANNLSEATNETTGKITMKKEGSAGIFGVKNSTLINKNIVELVEKKSAGIYAQDSDTTNAVTAGSPVKKATIDITKEESAGIYSILTKEANGDKKILNAKLGTDKAKIVVGTASTSSAGIYGKLTKDVNTVSNPSLQNKVLTLQNDGDIEVGSKGSVGIYGQNETYKSTDIADNLLINNSGLIKVSAEGSVGINANRRVKVTNSGTGIANVTAVTNTTNGILLTAKSTAGIIGKNGSEIINDGDINLASATQPSGATEGLVGISIDDLSNDDKLSAEYTSTGFKNSTVTNNGTITVNTDYSTGISGKAGRITNNTKILLNNTNSVGIASTDGSVINSAGTNNLIEVKESNSVGIFAKLTENAPFPFQAILNKGTITLNGGNTKTSSVGIYSLIEDKAVQANKTQTILNTGEINVGTKGSAGIYIKDNRTTGTNLVSLVGNEKDINVTEESSAGIIGEYSQITNGNPLNTNGKIKLSAKKTAGIIANKKSVVINHGTIETSATVTVSNNTEGLVGISADNSTVTNKDKEDSSGMMGTITLNTAYSTGIYGKNESTLTNEGSITANKKDSIAMAGENSKLINKNQILLNEEKSVGMFGTTVGNKNTVLINEFVDDPNPNNRLTGKITTKKKESVGMFVSTSQASAINKGTILIEEEKSAGMYGDEANIENTGISTNLVASITTKKDESAGMYAKNSNATNKKKITIEGKKSAGILVEMKQGATPVLRNISGTNDRADNASDTVNGLIEIKNKESAGMYGIVDNLVTEANSTLTLLNKKTINIDSKSSVGMMLINNSAAITKEKVKAENTGTINLNGTANTDTENIGILAKINSTAINKDNGIINVNTKESIGMLAKEGSYIENSTNIPANPPIVGQEYGINLKEESGIGMYAEGVYGTTQYSTAVNKAKISIGAIADKSIGMYAKDSGEVKNEKDIEVLAKSGVGIFVSDTGKGENKNPDGKIDLLNEKSVGIFAKNNGNTYTAKNSGTINLGTADGKIAHTSLIGMFAQAETGKTATVQNTADGIINVNTKKSVGMYGQNTAVNVTDVDLQNLGTININNQGSAGIYAPKTNISKVGTIKMKNTTDSDGSSAVYVSEGGKVADTTTGTIDLGTVNQNRVAYYVNGANSILDGNDIGKITGYGVGVYLEGSSTKYATIGTAKLGSTSPKLHYKNSVYGTSGDGIIGLFLSGSTEVKDYTAGIIVGDTVPADPNITGDIKKYAIGIYADKQGATGTPYQINTSIKAGKEGVGIFSDNNSVIDYKGHIKVGNGAAASTEDEVTAGIGIYITKSTGGNQGVVNLVGSKTDTSITLNGTGGVAVIASEGTKFDGGNATINLTGTGNDIKGVGVYAKKGSEVNINNWTFNNNGNTAEEVRSEEGKAHISAALKQLKPKMVLSHVINGETSIATGSKVVSVDDNPHEASGNIGLMAEGIKNPTMTWTRGNYEIVNDGTIDFSIAEKSTAIFANSARVNNNGSIMVGANSTAIYGVYDSTTRTYEVVSPATALPNKLEIDTTANSKISLGNNSTGMYLINAQSLNNTGGEIKSVSGATKNVGIYAINGAVDKGNTADNTAYNKTQNYKTLNMTTATDITLGDGSVGLYTRGQSDTDKNTVTNTGNITVGKSLTNAPAVAIYAENTKLDTNSNITVGENALAFYGKNSEIVAKGTANFSNKGTLAYLEKSKFTAYYGDLVANQKTMLFVKNSIATLNGLGPKIDITVNDKLATTTDSFAGAYIEGNSQLNGVKKITVGKNSNGVFLKDAIFTSNIDDIIGTKEGAKGLLALNSNLTTNSKISLSGDNSIGIYSDANSSKTIVNNGELTLAGKQTLGIFLKGSQTFENTANINIADSVDSKLPTIGVYTATVKDAAGNILTEGARVKHTSGIIEVGEKSIGIYSKASANVDIDGGKIHVKDQGIGIYKEAGKLTIKGELDIDPHVATAKDSEPTGVYAVNGAQVDDQASKISVGEKSYGFILNNNDSTKTNTYISGNTGTVSMGNNSVFLYSNGNANIVNNRTINSNGSEHLIAFYIKNGGDFTNNGTIDFSSGKGNIGVYAPGGKASNRGNIFVGKTDDIDPATGKVYSDVSKIVYGIGMAADNGGHIVNDGTIRIYNNKSIGMYGSGVGTVVENGVNGKILLDGSRATATDKIQSMTGVYVDEGATFRNFGTITTTDSYAGRDGKINENVSGLTGVAVMNGSTLINEASGKILIDADNSSGVVIRGKRDASGNLVRNAVIKNYGEIKVRGKGATAISWKDVSAEDIANLQKMINDKITSDPNGREIGQAAGTNKDFQGVSITVQDGKPVFRRNGRIIDDVAEVEKINELIGSAPNLAMSDVGFYVDTLGRTRPVEFEGANPPVNSQLIIGTEYSERTNKKEWFVSGNVIKPFLDQIQGRNFKLTTLAGSLTWIATPVLDNYGQITGVAMSKLSYTSFVKREDNAYNFADGLEQRYNMNALDSVEKRIFNKLNSIGKNEEVLLTQAFDEMMGHQYANVQQRVQATGMILDKEFSYLRGSWTNPTKDSNKIKTFGMKGEYKTDTAGVIDYKNNAYGVAYVHENEDIKLGKGTGWYTGIVHNTFKFKDIGNSKEEQLQAKVGLFKSVPLDDNNSLNWTISGDIFAGHNKLERKFLVVDEIFHAKSKYYTYGIGVKNEIGKEFRLSEGFSIRPYGALKVEYGRVSKIKEKSGEMKLEVKENDYLSIRPEVGTELAYKHYFGTKSLTASVGLAYENELGRVANGKNKARVAGTTADWFNIRGEKEDRKGNVKVDLNVGLDNQRFGVTGNVGYDTKGSNVRGGVGLRVIF